MAEHDEHSSFIKTPKQLITIVLLAFVVPIVGIVMLVQLMIDRPHADPSARSRATSRRRDKELGYEPSVALFDGMRASVRFCLERGQQL